MSIIRRYDKIELNSDTLMTSCHQLVVEKSLISSMIATPFKLKLAISKILSRLDTVCSKLGFDYNQSLASKIKASKISISTTVRSEKEIIESEVSLCGMVPFEKNMCELFAHKTCYCLTIILFSEHGHS